MACLRKRRGKWVVDYYLRGRRKVTSFGTKSEAEAFRKDLSMRPIDVATGYDQLKPMNLKTAINRYYTTVCKVNKLERSWQMERLYFERIFDYFGNMNVSEISQIELEDFQLHLLKKVSASTVNRHFNCFRNFFNKCVEWKCIKETPCRYLKNLKAKKNKKVVWTDQQISQLLSLAAPWMRDALLFAVYTGVRAGEIERLKWGDVDLAKNVMEITSFKGRGEARTRYLPIVESVREILDRRLALSREIRASSRKDSVFLNSSNNPVRSSHLSRETRRLAEKAGLKGLNLHGLRHTYITGLAVGDHNMDKIRQLVGHSNLRTTQEYLHVHVDHLREAAESVASNRKF